MILENRIFFALYDKNKLYSQIMQILIYGFVILVIVALVIKLIYKWRRTMRAGFKEYFVALRPKVIVFLFRKIVGWKHFYMVFIAYATILSLNVFVKYKLQNTQHMEWDTQLVTMRELLLFSAITAVLMYMMLKYGLDNRKFTDTVEVNPPAGIDPAIAGLVYNGEIKAQTPLTILMRLESKGYISMKPVYSRGKSKNSSIENFKVKKVYTEPSKPCAPETLVSRKQMSLELISPMYEKLPMETRVLLGTIFSKSSKGLTVGSRTTIYDKKVDIFNSMYDEVVGGGYVIVLEDNSAERQRELDRMADEYRQLCEKYEEDMRTYKAELEQLPHLTRIEKILYRHMFLYDNEVYVLENDYMNAGLRKIYKLLNVEIRGKVFDAKATAAKSIACVMGLFALVHISCILYLRAPLPPSYRWVYYSISFLLAIIGIACTFMDRRTVFGEELVARFRGFRKFIKDVEAERLRVLVNDNPNYFFDILPYAYILGVSKIWIKKANMIGYKLYDDFFDNDSFEDILKMFDSNMDYVVKSVDDQESYSVDEFFDREYYRK